MPFQPVGPAHLFLGDPTTANGADMTQLGLVRNVQFDWGVRNAFTSKDAVSGVPVADGIYTLASQPECQADLQDHSLDMIEAVVLNATRTDDGSGNTAVGVPDTFGSVAAVAVPTFCLLPVQQEADLADAANAIWLPAVTIQGANGLSFGRVEEGEIDQGYNVSFQSAWRDEDQAATAIPAGNRVGFMGPPAALSLPWSLPALS